jgi:hypothetical protein
MPDRDNPRQVGTRSNRSRCILGCRAFPLTQALHSLQFTEMIPRFPNPLQFPRFPSCRRSLVGRTRARSGTVGSAHRSNGTSRSSRPAVSREKLRRDSRAHGFRELREDLEPALDGRWQLCHVVGATTGQGLGPCGGSGLAPQAGESAFTRVSPRVDSRGSCDRRSRWPPKARGPSPR